MSDLIRRAAVVARWTDVPVKQLNKAYFQLGQNAHGLWVIRENTGRKAGVFLSREAALRFARLESPEELVAVVRMPGILEFDYAA